MHGPGTAVGRAAGTEDEVGSAVENRSGDAGEVAGVEGAVTVHETNDAVGGIGGQETGPASRPEAANRLHDDVRAGSAGDVSRAVG